MECRFDALKDCNYIQQHHWFCCREKDVKLHDDLSSLSEIAKADKRMLEMLKIQTVEALEKLKKESELFAKKITDAGR